MIKLNYRPEIDGLRALAVLPVVGFHFSSAWVPGGFLGVDVFFVISGFLITSIILKEHAEGSFTLKDFWVRRIRRLYPALLTMLFVTALVGHFVLLGPERRSLASQGFSVLAVFANVKMWLLTSGYWGAAAMDLPLLHTWSLAIEEQFYILFPVALLALLRWCPRWAFRVIVTGALVSFALCLVGTARDPSMAFYLLPTRAWELAAGCLLAMRCHSQPMASPAVMRFAPQLAIAGLATVLASFFLMRGGDALPGWRPLVPVIGTLLVIAFATNGDGAVKRLLSTGLMTYVGRLSYSIYLWHWPVIVFAQQLERVHGWRVPPSILPFVIGVLSVLSYHFVESVRHLDRAWRPLSLLVAAAAAAFVFLHNSKNENFAGFAPVEWRGRLYNVGPPWPEIFIEIEKRRMADLVIAEPPPRDPRLFATTGVVQAHGGKVPAVVVLGDSHALMWAATIDEVCREAGATVSFMASNGMPPFINLPPTKTAAGLFSAEDKFDFDTARVRALQEWRPAVVVVAARWSNEKSGNAPLHQLVEFLGTCAGQVVLIEQPPMFNFGDRNALHQTAHLVLTSGPKWNNSAPMGEVKAWEEGRRLIRGAADRFSFCRTIEVADLFFKGHGHAWILDGNHMLYIDDDHLSQYGAAKAKDRIRQRIEHALRVRR